MVGVIDRRVGEWSSRVRQGWSGGSNSKSRPSNHDFAFSTVSVSRTLRD